jgi:two-component system LytT family response regulator
VLVDDEPLARRKLRRFLDEVPEVEVVGEAVDGSDAVEQIDRLRPDLVLLDIQMPGMDGLDVAQAISAGPMPFIVFVTAYNEHALRAFDVGAVDYLLKPVDPDRFRVTLDRVLGRLREGQRGDIERRITRAIEAAAPGRPRLDRFLIKARGRSTFLMLRDIEWIEADGNYLRLHAAEGSHLVRGTMKALERRLDPACFARIHRSTAINLDRVKHIEPWSHGDQLVVMRSGRRLMLSRRYRDRIPPALGLSP